MIDVVAAVIMENDSVLLASRPLDKPPAGWEFPGGKIEPGETPFDAVKRELIEELDLAVEPVKEIYTLVNEKLTLRFILSRRLPDSCPAAREKQDFKWHSFADGIPHGLLANDLEFWDFLCKYKINHP